MADPQLEIKKNGTKDNFSVRVFQGKKRGSTIYHNIIDRDPTKIAQILLDLEIVESFPIEKAVKIYIEKRKGRDWLFG